MKNQYKNPKWWSQENDSAWDRVKEAMKRDWDQTKHDFGGDEPDTNQNVSNTVKQAAGTETLPPRHEPTYEEWEPAYRFGYGARSRYGADYDNYADWDDELKRHLNGIGKLSRPKENKHGFRIKPPFATAGIIILMTI